MVEEVIRVLSFCVNNIIIISLAYSSASEDEKMKASHFQNVLECNRNEFNPLSIRRKLNSTLQILILNCKSLQF